MGKFRLWLEDSEDILKIVKNSPNFKDGAGPPVNWDRYKQAFGLNNAKEWKELTIPMRTIDRLMKKRLLFTSPVSWKTVEEKMESKQYNPTVITVMTIAFSDGKGPLGVLDGTHSLFAAIENKEPNIKAIVSDEALDFMIKEKLLPRSN